MYLPRWLVPPLTRTLGELRDLQALATRRAGVRGGECFQGLADSLGPWVARIDQARLLREVPRRDLLLLTRSVGELAGSLLQLKSDGGILDQEIRETVAIVQGGILLWPPERDLQWGKGVPALAWVVHDSAQKVLLAVETPSPGEKIVFLRQARGAAQGVIDLAKARRRFVELMALFVLPEGSHWPTAEFRDEFKGVRYALENLERQVVDARRYRSLLEGVSPLAEFLREMASWYETDDAPTRELLDHFQLGAAQQFRALWRSLGGVEEGTLVLFGSLERLDRVLREVRLLAPLLRRSMEEALCRGPTPIQATPPDLVGAPPPRDGLPSVRVDPSLADVSSLPETLAGNPFASGMKGTTFPEILELLRGVEPSEGVVVVTFQPVVFPPLKEGESWARFWEDLGPLLSAKWPLAPFTLHLSGICNVGEVHITLERKRGCPEIDTSVEAEGPIRVAVNRLVPLQIVSRPAPEGRFGTPLVSPSPGV